MTQWYQIQKFEWCDTFWKMCVLISRPSLVFFKNKAGTDAVLPVFLRRNSFTPLSSQDQIKRPRLHSVGNPPQSRMSQAHTLPSMQFSEASEGAELLQNEVGAVNVVCFLNLYTNTSGYIFSWLHKMCRYMNSACHFLAMAAVDLYHPPPHPPLYFSLVSACCVLLSLKSNQLCVIDQSIWPLSISEAFVELSPADLGDAACDMSA